MNEWMNHPAMKQLDPIKQELIRTAAMRTRGKTGKTLAPVMMSLITSANKKGVTFSSSEISLILEILKEGKSESERNQIDHMVNVVQQMKKNGPSKS